MYQAMNTGVAMGGILAVLLSWGDLCVMVGRLNAAPAPRVRVMPMPQVAEREEWLVGEWAGVEDDHTWCFRLREDGTAEGLVDGQWFRGEWRVMRRYWGACAPPLDQQLLRLDIDKGEHWGGCEVEEFPINDDTHTIGCSPAFRRVQ